MIHDQEIEELRKEFLDSLTPRSQALRRSRETGATPSQKKDLLVLHTHRIAGIAPSFGFQNLGKLAVLFEEYFSESDDTKLAVLDASMDLMAEAIEATVQGKSIEPMIRAGESLLSANKAAGA